MNSKLLALLCTLWANFATAQITTTTNVGRVPLAHPDLGHIGGASLHTKVATIYTLLSDHLDSRYFEFSLTNGNFLDFTHNFQTPFLDVGWTLYQRDSGTGELTVIDDTTTPNISDFTIAGGSDVTDQIRVTNVSAGSQTLALVIFQGKDKISSLHGVGISSPTDNQALIYNSSTKKWENKSLGTAANTASTGISLTNLNDVVIAAPANGDIVYFDSANWVDTTLAALANTASIGIGQNDLNDTVITAAANGDLLQHNGTSWVDRTPSAIADDATTGIPLDSLNNVTAPTPQDGQALVFDAVDNRWEPGASGDASFKIQSTTATQVVIKGGTIEGKDGRQYKTYNGGGPAETNFGVDLTCTLQATPPNNTLYYLAIPATPSLAAITITETGQKVYPFTCAALVQLQVQGGQGVEHFFAQGFQNDPGGYIFLGYVRSATTGNSYTGTGSRFGDLARRSTNTPMNRTDGSLSFNFYRNSNYDFEQSESGETSSNGSVAGWTVTATIGSITNSVPIAGSKSLVLNSTASFASESATGPAAAPLKPGQRGKSCLLRFKYLYPTGAAGDWTAKVIDTQGPTDVTTAQSLAVTSSTVANTFIASFPCADSATATYAPKLTPTANSGDLTIDEVYLGLDDRIGSQTDGAELIAKAYYPAAAGCEWDRTGTTMGRFTDDSAQCADIVVENSALTVTTTNGDYPRITFPSLPPGKYEITATFESRTTTTASFARGTYALSDADCASSFSGHTSGVSSDATNKVSGLSLTGSFVYTTTAARSFEICGDASSGHTLSILANDTTVDNRVNFTVKRFPNQSPRDTVTLDLQRWFIEGTIQGTTTFSVGSSASLVDLTTATVQSAVDVDSAPVFIACPTTEVASASTCATNESLGIAFDAPYSGQFLACFGLPIVTNNVALNQRFVLVVTPNNDASTNTKTGSNLAGFSITDGGVQSDYTKVCEIFALDAGRRTIRVKHTNNGSITGSEIIHTNSGTATPGIYFSVIPLGQNFTQGIALTDAVQTTKNISEQILGSSLNIGASETDILTYTITQAGNYYIDGNCSFSNGQSDTTAVRYSFCMIRKNGTTIAQTLCGIANNDGGASDFCAASVSTILNNLVAGDVVRLTGLASVAGVVQAHANSTNLIVSPFLPKN